MVKAIINICAQANHVLNIVKAKEGFKDKSQTINHIALKYAEHHLSESLTPSLLQKAKEIENKSYVEVKETRY